MTLQILCHSCDNRIVIAEGRLAKTMTKQQIENALGMLGWGKDENGKHECPKCAMDKVPFLPPEEKQ